MNYTIIGHSADSSYYDRCGDHVSQPGKFETHFFREEQRADFLRAWASAVVCNTYEDLIILIDGVPETAMTEAEWETFSALSDEMYDLQAEVKAERDARIAAAKEAAAQEAVRKAAALARAERERDMQQLAALQRKLGLK
jgi:hypothetical protein